jgi:hypothetical protein
MKHTEVELFDTPTRTLKDPATDNRDSRLSRLRWVERSTMQQALPRPPNRHMEVSFLPPGPVNAPACTRTLRLPLSDNGARQFSGDTNLQYNASSQSCLTYRVSAKRRGAEIRR